MNKQDFLNQLKQALYENKISDPNEVLDYYTDLIEGQIEKGITEQEAIQSLSKISDIILELKDSENGSNNNFTFSNYIQARPVANTILGDKITSSSSLKKVKSYHINIDKEYCLNTKLWERNIEIIPSDSNTIDIEYKKSFSNPIEVFIHENQISVIERIHRIWVLGFIQMIVFAGLYIGFYFIFKNQVSQNGWWHALILFLTLVVHGIIFSNHYYKNSKNKKILVKLPKAKSLNQLYMIQRSGKAELSSIYATTFNINAYSATCKINDSFAHYIYLKNSSGHIRFGNPNQELKFKSELLNTITSSGSTKIYGLNAQTISAKVSSGSLLLDNIKSYDMSLKCSSGSLKGNGLMIENNISVNLSSGVTYYNDISFKSALLNAKSGYLTLDNIKGSSNDYILKTKYTSGSIKINREKVANIHTSNTTSKDEINAKVSSGSIKLNFLNK
ncbi:hypothetical protein BN85401260 [Alteracholeplasma palmae J233]|uniref:DUF4097 domain-containing protein n=1 Tax=Alteracholeplasma palmae (strain ATCC 49389 / J233) TaxID=1318466 RepID=U4KJT8_ALTPJ|nr:DUF4097 family beta strand repeat-containing protein [Alteracholeplasma palmae]CCV63703.1 hypothetical protein BN85401260 [Alteracholeplasma palmae J233]